MVFDVDHLEAFEYDETVESPDGSTTQQTVREFPYRGYLRYLRTTADPTVYDLQFDVEVTWMGEELLARNPSKAEQWVTDRYDRYPSDFSPKDTNTLQSQLEAFRDGTKMHSATDVQQTGGQLTIDSIEPITVQNRNRSLYTCQLETDGVFEVQLDTTARLTIDTGGL